jgi:hypothetical protein
MRHQHIDIYAIKRAVYYVLWRKAQAVNAAIAHDMASPAACVAPDGKLLWRIQHWRGPQRPRGGNIALGNTI